MTNNIVTGNPDLGFFEQNPQLKYISVFNEIIRSFPDNYDKILWAIYMTEDPSSKLYNMPKDQRRTEVASNYLEDSKFNWEQLEEIIAKYVKVSMSKEKLMYKMIVDKMETMVMRLKSLDETEDKDWRKIMNLLEKSSKIWDSLDKVKERLENSEEVGTIKGGAQRSFREKRNK